MIQVNNLVKRFYGFEALNGISMRAPRGCIYGLVGPNGAGKTTLIRHLTGVYRQDSGTVEIDGRQVFENPEIKSRIAYIPDEIYYFPQAGARDMMKFYKGIYPRFDVQRYKKLRDVFSGVDEKRAIRRLSKGMQKQVAFWLALCCNPDVVILDEPVDGLDPVMRRQVWSILMGEVVERGVTVVVSSHNLRELEDVCDHVGIMNQGKLILERSLSELQGNVTKVQAVFENELPDLSQQLNILSASQTGRIHTLIIKGRPGEVTDVLSQHLPLFVDALPLSLEEIFIYELGGEDYAVKDVIL